VDLVIRLDTEWRKGRGDLDTKKGEVNALNKQIAPKKKAKENCDELLAQQAALKSEIDALTQQVEQLERQVNDILREMGNIVHEAVPVSMDEVRLLLKTSSPADADAHFRSGAGCQCCCRCCCCSCIGRVER
jgi:seryl-tRNA synthetase